MKDSSKDALAGVRVLDLSEGIAGPLCAKLLADHGADVVKVEPPTGEAGRRMPPFHQDDPNPEKSLFFLMLNLNKRGITLDIDKPEGAALLRQLAEHVDIIVESGAPGHLASVGLCHSRLRETRPGLVMTSITPFGQSGPSSACAGEEIVAYACAGVMAISGTTDREPLKHGGFQAQYQAGLSAASATGFALLQSELHGLGEHVDVSVQEVVASTMVASQSAYAWTGGIGGRRPPGAAGLGTVMPCQDGYFVAQASWRGSSSAWDALVAFFDRPELREPQFVDAGSRLLNAEQLEAIFLEAARSRTMAEMFRTASEKYRMLLGIVQTPEDLAACKQLAARDFFADVDHPVIGRVQVPFRLWNMSSTPARYRCPAPLLGQHNPEVYQDLLGLGQKELEALKAAGTI